MTSYSMQALTGAGLWAALIVMAHVMTPGQSFMSVGLSGLTKGRVGWIAKVAYVFRGMVALALVAAVVHNVPVLARSYSGMLLFVAWGAGSALLAVYDNDLPGEKPTVQGLTHVLIALVADLAGSLGMILMSVAMVVDATSRGAARWALPIALIAAIALIVQTAAFAAAARTPGRGLARYAGLLQRVFLVLLMVWIAIVAILI